jgi:hypothetical protein
MSVELKRFLAYSAVVLGGVLLVLYIQGQTADTLYRNNLDACERGAPVREGLHRFATAAAEARTYEAEHTDGEKAHEAWKAARTYESVAAGLEATPYALPSGAIDCERAVQKP